MNEHQLKNELLRRIVELQQDCASITLRIGGVYEDNQVDHVSITILESPPAIFEMLSSFKADAEANGDHVFISAGRGGIDVRCI